MALAQAADRDISFSPLYIGVSGATKADVLKVGHHGSNFQSPLHRGEWCNGLDPVEEDEPILSFSPLYIGVSGATRYDTKYSLKDSALSVPSTSG